MSNELQKQEDFVAYEWFVSLSCILLNMSAIQQRIGNFLIDGSMSVPGTGLEGRGIVSPAAICFK